MINTHHAVALLYAHCYAEHTHTAAAVGLKHAAHGQTRARRSPCIPHTATAPAPYGIPATARSCAL